MSYSAYLLVNHKQLAQHSEAINESAFRNYKDANVANAWKELRFAFNGKPATLSKLDIAFISKSETSEESLAIQQLLDQLKVDYTTAD